MAQKRQVSSQYLPGKWSLEECHKKVNQSQIPTKSWLVQESQLIVSEQDCINKKKRKKISTPCR